MSLLFVHPEKKKYEKLVIEESDPFQYVEDLSANCHKELCHLQVKKQNTETKKKVFRCLVCHECASSESKQPTFVTRDLNSALNIHNLAPVSYTHLTLPTKA